MRANVVLDGALVEEAARLTAKATKRELVAETLCQLIATRRRKGLAE